MPVNPSTLRRAAGPLALLCGGLLLLFGGLGGTPFRGLYDDVDRALIARNMADTGDWLVPNYLGKPLLTKPPLMYWTGGLAYRLTGREDELPARLPSAAGMGLLVFGTAYLGWRLRDRRTGLLAGAMLLTTYLFLAMARQPLIDSVMLGGLGVGLIAIAELMTVPPERRTRWWLLLAAAFAWSAMTKGPVLLPVLLLILAPGLRGPAALRPSRRQTLLMAALLVLLLVPWPVIMLHAVPEAADVWRTELFGRFTGSSAFHAWTQKPWWFYLPDLVNTLPWLPLWLAGAVWAWRQRRDPVAAMLLWWALGGVLFFSLASATKRSYYLLPLYPAFALLAADAVRGRTLGLPAFPRRTVTIGLAATTVIVGMMVAALVAGAATHILAWGWPILAGTASLAGWWAEGRPRGRLPGPVSLVAATGAVLLAWHVAIVPPLNAFNSGQPFFREARKLIATAPEETLILCDVEVAMSNFYLHTQVYRFVPPKDLAKRLDEFPSGWLVSKPGTVAGLPRLTPVLERELKAPITGKQEVFGLYRLQPLLAD